MKKPVAALLLIIYLFSIAGQLTLHQYFSYLADKFFTSQTAKGLYNSNDLTEIQVPVNMPNIAEWAGYENVSGRIVFNNVSYNYVKMRITRTKLYLVCVPNYSTTRLVSQNVIDARQAKSIPVSKKEHVPFGKVTFTGKFNFAFAQVNFSNIVTTLPEIVVPPSQRLAFQFRDIPKQPPKPVC